MNDEFDDENMNGGDEDDAVDKFSAVVNDAREAVNDRFDADVDAALDALADRLKGSKTFLGAAHSLWYSSGAAAAVAAVLGAAAGVAEWPS
jgi:hypothetical protein